MDKLKEVFSSSSKRTDDPQHSSASQEGAEGYHPIYDQFTKEGVNEGQQSTGTADHVPKQSSTLRPDSAHGTGASGEAMSTASIKSGVLGFPQGAPNDEHAAISHADSAGLSTGAPEDSSAAGRSFPLAGGVSTGEASEQAPSSGQALGTQADEARLHGEHDNHGREGLAGAAAAATASSAIHRHEDRTAIDSQPMATDAGHHTRHQETVPTAAATSGFGDRSEFTPRTETGETGERSHHASTLPTTTTTSTTTSTMHHHDDRSELPSRSRATDVGERTHHTEALPAAAAVAASMHEDRGDVQSQPKTTTEAEGSSRKGPLAAALAAITRSKDKSQPDTTHETSRTHQPEALSAATATAPRHEERGDVTSSHAGERSHHPEALAAATAAATHSTQQGHSHGGFGHEYHGDPCETDENQTASGSTAPHVMVASGPHQTNAANMFDPKLHVPGEFPSPTPHEESSAESYLQSKPTTTAPTETRDQPGLRHTGTLQEPQTRAAGQSYETSPEHHHGRDLAAAGGLGAAGIGAHEAHKHHQKESADIGGETIPAEPSPYSSTQIDPRVYGSHRDATSTTTTQASEPSTSRTTYPSAGEGLEERSQHHGGRDAALVGAGAATAGGIYASQRSDETDSGPASGTIGSHKSNIANVLDPRVQPDPTLQKHQTATQTAEDPASSTVGPHKSNLANVLDPRVQPDPEKQSAALRGSAQDEHHYGRDAATVGGVGAAGYGAHEMAKTYDEHRATQPEASMTEQRFDPTERSSHGTSQPTATHADEPKQHHYGRDAAAAGGLGAAGAGLYAATRDHDQAQPSTTHQGFEQPSATQAYQQPSTSQAYQQPSTTQAYQQPSAAQAYQQPSTTQAYQQPSATHDYQRSTGLHGQQQPTDGTLHQTTQDPTTEDHHKRDVALASAAAAGAGAGGAGAYAYSQHDEQKAQQEQLKQQEKAFQAQQKEAEKQHAKEQKELEKQHAKEQKHHDKLVAAEEKKHDKALEKEAAKEEKRHEKELEKEEKESEKKEKKHHLFGFLHRSKKDKEEGNVEDSPRESHDDLRHSKEYAGAGAVAGGALGGAAAYDAAHDSEESEGRRGDRNRLHKDPPPGHPARELMERSEHADMEGQQQGLKPTHMGIDGEIGSHLLVDDGLNKHSLGSGATEGYGHHGQTESQAQGLTSTHMGTDGAIGSHGHVHDGVQGHSSASGATEEYRGVPQERHGFGANH